MADFPKSQRAAIQKAFDEANEWIDKLLKANAKRDSDIRATVAQELADRLDELGQSGFFEESDFSQDEQDAIFACSSTINEAIESIRDSNDIVLMELGADLAELVTKLGQRAYTRLLLLHWLSLRRQSRLPREPPDDVQDEFNVHLFNLAKGRLSQIARNCRPVADFGCLNPDDYDSDRFNPIVLAQSKIAADLAANSYIAAQELKAEEEAARNRKKLGILDEVWAFVGWDSPMDFLVDIGLTVATGGASKIVRWTERAIKTTKRLRRGVNVAERALRLEQRAQRYETRIKEIKKAAEALKRTRRAAEIPKKLLAAIRMIEAAEKQLKFLSQMKKAVQPDYIRSVASTVASRSIGPGETNAGGAATYELARQSILSAVNGTILGKMIEELREDVNFTSLIFGRDREQAEQRETVFILFALLVTREMIVRLAIQTARKRKISLEIFVVEFEGAAFNALESILIDAPILSKVKASELARTFVSTIRKAIAGLAQRAFEEWYEA